MSRKPPLLFLHGAFGGPEMWLRFVAHAVAAPPLPGTGAPGRARLRDYVRAARRAADALGGRPVVIGHSLGGLVAQHLATERRLAGLALIGSPGPAGLGPSLWRLSAQQPGVLAALMVAQAGATPRGGRCSPRTRPNPGSSRSARRPPRKARSP